MLSEEERAARLKLVEDHIQAENDHNIERTVGTFGAKPEFILNGMRLVGKDQIRELYGSFGFGGNGSFSDLEIEMIHQHVGDDSIVLEVELRGKHTGNFQNLRPTGRIFEVPLCAIFTFDADGMLAGERVYFDSTILFKQLGILE